MSTVWQSIGKKLALFLPIKNQNEKSISQQKLMHHVISIQALVVISFAALLFPFSKHLLAHLTGGFIVVLANSTLLLSRRLKPAVTSLILVTVSKYVVFASLLLMCHAFTTFSFPQILPLMIATQLSFPMCCYFAERLSWR